MDVAPWCYEWFGCALGLGVAELEIDQILNYFQERIDYGVMNSCLVKPALYLVQVTSTD